MRRRPRRPPLYARPAPPEPIDPAEQRDRGQRMASYDDLPEAIRRALSASPFDLHIGLRNRHWNVEGVVSRIAKIASTREAVEFNQEMAARHRFARL